MPDRSDNPLARKLRSFTDLDAVDEAALDGLCADTRRFKAGDTLIRTGVRPDHVYLMVSGWACRYKLLGDGSRAIMALLLPGDLSDVHMFIMREMDHSIALLSEADVVLIPKAEMLAIIRDRPRIAQALLWATMVDEAILREWLVNVGRRRAYERLAHLFCELSVRGGEVGLVENGEFLLPLTQEQLGDVVSLTSVHVNRSLQRLRNEKLITFQGKRLFIRDLKRLEAVAGFDSSYLHLRRRLS